MNNVFVVLIKDNVDDALNMAELLNDSVYIIDLTSKVSKLSQVHARVLSELRMSQNTHRNDVDVMYVNDFVQLYNNHKSSFKKTVIAFVSI